jgi:hypothetical protein
MTEGHIGRSLRPSKPTVSDRAEALYVDEDISQETHRIRSFHPAAVKKQQWTACARLGGK